MNRLAIYALIALGLFGSGFGTGWHAKTVRTNAAVVKQVAKVAKIEAKDEVQVEKQNDADKIKIAALEDKLSAARRDAAARRVPIPPQHSCAPATERDAGPREERSDAGKSAGRYEEAYRALRDELLLAGAEAEQLRLQAQSCQAQWPH